MHMPATSLRSLTFFFFKSIVYEPYATENKHARLELFHCKALLQTSQSV